MDAGTNGFLDEKDMFRSHAPDAKDICGERRNPMNKKIVKIQFKKGASQKACEIIVDDLRKAIDLNHENYPFLEEVRKTLVLALMQVEHLESRIKYPELMSSKVNGY